MTTTEELRHLLQGNEYDFRFRFNFINPRRACAARVTVVGSVCLSVTLHLTSRMSVRLKNDTIYLTGTEGQKIS